MANNTPTNIPVAILIFNNGGQITYRAYSPNSYNLNNDGTNPDHQSEQFGQFLARIHNQIAYDLMQPINTITNFGQLKEIHTRHITVPITERCNEVCYFTTYNHPHCNYNPVHRESPVFFNVNQANNYASMYPNLFHYQCSHEFI